MTQTLTPPKVQTQPSYTLTDADKARQRAIQHAWDAYNGNLPKPLVPMSGEPDDNVMSNRCQPIVDRGVDFLFGKELEISVEEGAPQEAQDFLDKIWGRKEMRIPLLQRFAMNGALTGRPFLRIVPGDDNTFRLVVIDPSIVFVQTAPQDCETVLLYCIEYSNDEKRDGKPVRVFYREEIARIDPDSDETQGYEDEDAEGIDDDVTWAIQHWTRIGERGSWVAAGEPYVWPYPFAPLFSNQNVPKPNDFWGIPDITADIIGVNNSLNLVQSCVNRILKLYGSPILYATGTGDATIDIKPGKIIGLPLSESKIVAVALASDVANAMTFAGNLRSDIDEQSSTPGVATGRIDIMPRGISGIAVELLYMPLNMKTEKKKCLYGATIIETSKALLVLAGFSPDSEITLSWQSALPKDDLPTIQGTVLKTNIGVSKATLQRELGYDPDEEAALNKVEEAQNPPASDGTLPGQPPAQPGQPSPMMQQPGQPGQESPFLSRGH